MHRGIIQFPDLLPARSLFVPCQLGDTLLQSGHLAVALLPSALPPTHPGVPPTAAQPKPLLNPPSSLVPGERPVPLLDAVLGPLGHGPPSTPTKPHTPAQRAVCPPGGHLSRAPEKAGCVPPPQPGMCSWLSVAEQVSGWMQVLNQCRTTGCPISGCSRL